MDHGEANQGHREKEEGRANSVRRFTVVIANEDGAALSEVDSSMAALGFHGTVA